MANGGFLGRLKDGINSQLWEEDGQSQSNPVNSAETQPPIIQPIAATQVATPTRTYVDNSQVDPEIKAALDQAVAEANQVSFTEFLNYREAMLGALAGQDEGTIYRAALAAATKKGFKSQEIARGIDAILLVFQREEKNFNSEASARLAEKVGSRQTELSRIDETIRENTNKIAQLQAEITDLSSRQHSISGEIQAEERKVQETKKRFSATVSVEKAKYEEERRKILAYSGKGA